METIHIAIANGNVLSPSDGWNYTTGIIFTDHAPNSRLLVNADHKMILAMKNLNITTENHRWGISP